MNLVANGAKTKAVLDIEALFEANANLDNYFTYSGSLTTPNCQESVTWIFFSKPIDITAARVSKVTLYEH